MSNKLSIEILKKKINQAGVRIKIFRLEKHQQGGNKAIRTRIAKNGEK